MHPLFAFEQLQENTPHTQIYAISLDYRLDEAGTKHYNQLLGALSEKGLIFKTKVRPLKRTLLSFKLDKKSCVFPASLNALVTNDPTIEHQSLVSGKTIDHVSLRIFTSPNRPVIKSISELNNKRVAILNGLNPDFLLKGINAQIEITSNEEVPLKMLAHKRLDAIIGHMPDVFLAADELGFSKPNFEKTVALFKDENISIVCHQTQENQKFINQFNDLLSTLKHNGELLKILGPHATIAP
jgi:ABC-type amino acid transport substrate-binding protein